MIFRMSQKMSCKINAGILNTLPLHDNSFADWSANLSAVNGKEFILLSNTKSLYSTAMNAKSLNDDSEFVRRASNLPQSIKYAPNRNRITAYFLS